MGNESSLDHPKVGYHVLQVHPNSPGQRAGLISFFDFIVGADDVFFEREDSRFVEILKAKIGQPVKLIIYNTREEKSRDTILIPNEGWGGNGLAGISIRFCSFENAHEHVWHVLEVYPNSPASVAQLQPRTDYIVGTPELLFNDAEDFFTLINFNECKPIPLYVYSSITDDVRMVSIVPNSKWGGTGSLGCDVGYGILHRIPLPSVISKPFEGISAAIAPPGYIQAQRADDQPAILPTSSSLAPTSYDNSAKLLQQQQQFQQQQQSKPQQEFIPPSSQPKFDEFTVPQNDWQHQDVLHPFQQPFPASSAQKQDETSFQSTSPNLTPKQSPQPPPKNNEDLQEIKL
jgi:hypothetical protein